MEYTDSQTIPTWNILAEPGDTNMQYTAVSADTNIEYTESTDTNLKHTGRVG
jgi:hypothetical protein